MRPWLVALIALAVPAATFAQTPSPEAPTGLPLPSIGLPLPSIGLAHPATGLPPVEATAPNRTDRSAATAPRAPHRRGGQAMAVAPLVTPWTPWLFGVPVAVPVAVAPAAPLAPADGRVAIETLPETAQVYVDGYYVGTPADYPDGLPLSAGPHAVEVRAGGYDTQATAIQVPRGRSISFRAVLTASAPPASPTAPAAASPPASPAAASAQTFYLIRGCYMGNVPPAEAALPSGCDPAKAIAVRP